jgi:very-short-patch-repair endonuclease
MTDVERKLWSHLRGRQVKGRHFRRQAAIGNDIADFACFAPRIVIELDGGQHGAQTKYDSKRDAWLQGRGFVILRFWNNEVIENLEGVLDMISRIVDQASSPPPADALRASDPPRGGGGDSSQSSLSPLTTSPGRIVGRLSSSR